MKVLHKFIKKYIKYKKVFELKILKYKTKYITTIEEYQKALKDGYVVIDYPSDIEKQINIFLKSNLEGNLFYQLIFAKKFIFIQRN